MKRYIVIIILFVPFISFSQIDSAFIARIKSLDTANILKLDTTSVPNDRLTQKIRELRNEKKGLSIETIIKIKIEEEKQKDKEHSKEYFDKLYAEVTVGKTGRLIDNCVINLYRRTFTEEEVDQLIAFYKTSAGKKMDSEFLIMLVESAKDAEYLLKLAAKNIQ